MSPSGSPGYPTPLDGAVPGFPGATSATQVVDMKATVGKVAYSSPATSDQPSGAGALYQSVMKELNFWLTCTQFEPPP